MKLHLADDVVTDTTPEAVRLARERICGAVNDGWSIKADDVAVILRELDRLRAENATAYQRGAEAMRAAAISICGGAAMRMKLEKAVAKIIRVTAPGDAWTGHDIANDAYDTPTIVDNAIAVILNAVVSGRLRIVEEIE